MVEASVSVGELPILGEALPLELANTRYGAGDMAIDFLATRALAELWLSALATVPPGVPRRLDARAHQELLTLRDVVYRLLRCGLAGEVPAGEDVAGLNGCLERGQPRPQLRWTAEPEVGIQWRGPSREIALGAFAGATLEWLRSGGLVRLRECAAADCTLLFERDHHRRRFCHEGCGHRMRQAAYYRRKRGST